MFRYRILAIIVMLLVGPATPTVAQAQEPLIVILDRDGTPTTQITDGNGLTIRLEGMETAAIGRQVRFILEPGARLVGECTVPAEQTLCEIEGIFSSGWYWETGGLALPERTIHAEVERVGLEAEIRPAPVTINISPRPVVMVHGFSSSWEAWSMYLGPQGFLASAGIQGYAVGDGQVAGVLNTGSLTEPASMTNTIAQNAAILGMYIEGVKQATGAERVDLLAHSMGGLISRFYIAHEMEEGSAAQLIMLGSPMQGTGCANLPAALGLYLPATLELRPNYITDVFNPQVEERAGTPFYALAGVPIQDSFRSPCTDAPSDLVVSLQSVKGISVIHDEMPILHTDLNTSEEVFQDFVLPLIQKTVVDFEVDDQAPGAPPEEDSRTGQFSRMYTGRVEAESEELVIHIESGVRVASFALYDETRSLQVRVIGAAGTEIELSPDQHGLVVVEDPQTLFYLGYGFENPRPGTWVVTLSPGPDTPPDGAAYSLTAYFEGGANLTAQISDLTALPDQPVQFTASLELNGEPITLLEASAIARDPRGEAALVEVEVEGNEAFGLWVTGLPGLYGVDLQVVGQTPGGETVERAAFLAVEVTQPFSGPTGIVWLAIYAALGLLAAALPLLLAAWFILRRRKEKEELSNQNH
jgi:pimeloyl-ACP methyl ester carboxylesterase